MTYTFLLYNTGGVRHVEVIKENQHGKLMKKLFPYSVSNCDYKNLLFYDYKINFPLLTVSDFGIVEKKDFS